MRILISGAGGFIGRSLTRILRSKGHEIIRLTRTDTHDLDAIVWDPDKGFIEKEKLEDFDAVIHLCGAPLALRWTNRQRRKILMSRTLSTFLLSSALSVLHRPPKVFISSSAVSFYGDRGEERLDERSKAGDGFLPKVCSEWEKASSLIEARGVRVVHPRMGWVLGKGGGSMRKLLRAYRWGVVGKLGSGRQWVSWVALEDVVGAFEFALQNEELSGPFNLVSPFPVRQEEFSAHFARLPIQYPPRLLRWLFGATAADEWLLSSAHVQPVLLQKLGFRFRRPTLDSV